MQYRYVRYLYRLWKIARNKLVDCNIILFFNTWILKTIYNNSDNLLQREEIWIDTISSLSKLRSRKESESIYSKVEREAVVKYIQTILLIFTRIELRKITSMQDKIFRKIYRIDDDSQYLSIILLLTTVIVYSN